MLNNPYLVFTYLLLFISVIFATITYKKYRNTPSRYFLWLLWFTILVELIGLIRIHYYSNHENHNGLSLFIDNLFLKDYIQEKYFKKMTWMYNLYRMVIFPIYIYYYYLLVIDKYKKKQIIYIFILCVVVSLIDLIINWNIFMSEKLMTTRTAGGIFILVASSIYLMEVLKSDELLTFHKTLPFWITFGALIFYLTTIPIFIFKDYLYVSNLKIYGMILYISNYFLYGCFIIGFIVNAIHYKKNEKIMKNE